MFTGCFGESKSGIPRSPDSGHCQSDVEQASYVQKRHSSFADHFSTNLIYNLTYSASYQFRTSTKLIITFTKLLTRAALLTALILGLPTLLRSFLRSSPTPTRDITRMAWRSSGSSNVGLVNNLASNGLITDPRVKKAMLSVRPPPTSPKETMAC